MPSENAAEASVIASIEVIAVSSLSQAVAFSAGALEVEPTPARLDDWFEKYQVYHEDFAGVRGQELAKRVVTIAAASGHNILPMLGPPVSGFQRFARFFQAFACAFPFLPAI